MNLKNPMTKKIKRKVKNKKLTSFARQLIKMPSEPVNNGIYTDWMEISAWAQSDGHISRQDIISSFTIGEEVKGPDDINSQAEEQVSQIWYEIKTRISDLQEAYPFALSENEENFFYKKTQTNLSYIFCLLISYYGLSDLMHKNTSKGSNLFEGLCTYVAHEYLSNDLGECGNLQFGSQRYGWEKKKRPLPKAVDELINCLGEGINTVHKIKVGQKIVADGGDGGLDVVAWRKFPDKRTGYLLFFGQCATAKNHSEYLNKLKEHQCFLETHLNIDMDPVFGFFLPHSLTGNDGENKGHWERIKMTKNIPFDRTRIALYGREWENEEVSKFLPVWQTRIKKENSLI